MSEDTFERRRNTRPAPVAPGINLRLDRLISPIMRRLHPPLRGAGLLWVLMGCCGLWTWWSLQVRMAPLRSYNTSVQREVETFAHIEQLQSALAVHSVDAIRSAIQQANDNILPGYEVLAEWLHQQARAAANVGLSFSYVLGDEVEALEVDDLNKIPVDITLKVNVHSAATDSYQRLLQQMQALYDSRWSKDLAAVSVEAVGGKAEIMQIGLQLWMHNDGSRDSTVSVSEVINDTVPRL